MSEFKIDNRVVSEFFGEGTVIHINTIFTNPVTVKFDKGNLETFTANGSFSCREVSKLNIRKLEVTENV